MKKNSRKNNNIISSADPRLDPDIELIDEAKRLYDIFLEANADNRSEQLKDMAFAVGEQWDLVTKRAREIAGKPVYTVDRLGQYVQNVTGDMRQNRPSMEVSPVGDGADVDTAEVISGLLRHIEQDSSAYSAYDNAAFYQVACGEGYYRISSRYVDENSFEQELRIRPVANPFSVVFDPMSQEPDGSDQSACFVVDEMSPYEYANKYPGTKLSQTIQSGGANWTEGTMDDWTTNSVVRVVEYWKKIFTPKVSYQVITVNAETHEVISSENTGEKPDEAASMKQALALLAEGQPATYKQIKATRKSQQVRIKQYILNGVEKISETDFPGRYIPIIPAKGNVVYVDGKKYTYGLIRKSRDPQTIYNTMVSAKVETIAMATKAPWLVAEGQIDEAYETMWEQSNTANIAYLIYKPLAIGGVAVPPPQRQTYEPAIQAISSTQMSAADDLRAVTGVQDAQLGIGESQESGKAILARQSQSSQTNFMYQDNLVRAVKHGAKILVDIIPHFYSEERMIRIIKPTGESQLVAINGYENDSTLGDFGNEKVHDLTIGKYDVVVTTGKSYTTKRQEGVDSMMTLAEKVGPEMTGLFADRLVADMDWPGAQIISKRLKAHLAMTNPGLLEAAGEEDKGADAEVKLSQATQQINKLNQGLQQAIEIGETLKNENEELKKGDVLKKYIADQNYDVAMKKLALDEQKIISDNLSKGMAHQATVAKAYAEVKKAQDGLELEAIKVAHNINESMKPEQIAQEYVKQATDLDKRDN